MVHQEQIRRTGHDIITHQLEVIGCSCDWKHERFTMDEGLSRAVREAFVTLYERGLIYKGEYLVNYCPHCQTALADDEVEYQSMQGSMERGHDGVGQPKGETGDGQKNGVRRESCEEKARQTDERRNTDRTDADDCQKQEIEHLR